MSYHYDFAVIGGGSGGVRAARIAATHGAKVVLFEEKDLGGTCVNVGCVPKKLMVYASNGYKDAQIGNQYGWSHNLGTFNWDGFLKAKNSEIKRLNSAYHGNLEKSGAEIIPHKAHFIDAHTLGYDNGKTVTADKILIATGGQPTALPAEGGELALTSDDMFFLEKLPKKILILGGGYIALEFASIFRNFDVDVDIVNRSNFILRGFDDSLRIHLLKDMKERGIRFHLNQVIDHLKKTENGIYALTTENQEFEVDFVLSAIGRTPNTDGLHLEAANIALDQTKKIKINQDFQTTQPNIFACGDVANSIQLTPVAIKEGHGLAERLFGKDSKNQRATHEYSCVPTAVFTTPPLGTAGITEEQAREKGYDIDVYQSAFTPMKLSMTEFKRKTLMKLIVDKKTDKVLGVHMVGEDAPEIIQGFAVAINAGATKEDFDSTIAIHPTSAEEFVTMRTPVIPSE